MKFIYPLRNRRLIYAVILFVSLLASNLSFGQCSDPYEPNDSKSTAKPIPTNQLIHALISTTLDVDYYRIDISASENNLRVILFNLPANYNLFVFNLQNDKIGSSKNKSLAPDTIILNELTAGTYWIKIRAKGGSFDPINCYNLSTETSETPFKIAPVEGELLAETSVFDLYPNPATTNVYVSCDDENVTATIAVYSLTGQKVYEMKETILTSTTTIDVSAFPAGQYFLEVRYAGGREMKKFVVTR